MGPKNQKRLSAGFLFFQFSFVALLSHWYQHWVKAAQFLLKHAEKQSETRRVESFGAKSGASAAKPHASGERRAKNFARNGHALAAPQPSSLKIDLKVLVLLF